MSLTSSDNALLWLQVPSSSSSAILLLGRVTPRVQVYFVANVRHVQWAIPQTPNDGLVFIQVIGHFPKYHDTLCLSPQILHKHCFQFLLGLSLGTYTGPKRKQRQCSCKIRGDKQRVL